VNFIAGSNDEIVITAFQFHPQCSGKALSDRIQFRKKAKEASLCCYYD
jgi:hypothetical protein